LTWSFFQRIKELIPESLQNKPKDFICILTSP